MLPRPQGFRGFKYNTTRKTLGTVYTPFRSGEWLYFRGIRIIVWKIPEKPY